jgi:hypothetical protein
MTYVLVTDKGTVETREGEPTTDDLIELTGKGVPELVRFPLPDLVAWVDDNWVARVSVGDYRRNVLPSVLWTVISGETPPAFGGPVVFTGYTEVDGQIQPTGIDETERETPGGQRDTLAGAVSAVLDEAAELLALPEDEYLPEGHPMARKVQDATRKVFAEIMTLPLGSLNGGYVPPSPVADLLMQALGLTRAQAEEMTANLPEEDPRDDLFDDDRIKEADDPAGPRNAR